MKEEIYTLPLMEAFEAGTECPFCSMRKTLENTNIAYFLSPAYMEVEVREETNRYGFCNSHLSTLAGSRNALGLSLMMQSHLAAKKASLEDLSNKLSKEKKTLKKAELVASMKESLSGCCICNRINETFGRYVDTFFYLWKKDKEFPAMVFPGKGFCLEHFLLLLEESDNKLSGSASEEFKALLWNCELQELGRIQEDLDWFIKKFDYRFVNEPWKNSKDALPRTLLKVNGLMPTEEKTK